MTNPTPKKDGAYASLTGFRRAVPIILIAFAVFTGLCFIMQDTGALGHAISSVLLGLFSIGGYFIPAFLVIHAIFYPSDVQKKRTLSRIIFTVLAVVTISALVHTIAYFDEAPVFRAKAFYVNGINSKGGGFIGGLIAFVLRKLFGRVGPIIIAVALFAIYITYFFAGGKSVFSRLLLGILNAISNFFTAIGNKFKRSKKNQASKREERRREELAAEQELLVDDEFFEADNGMKELTITKLGINEVRDDAEIERNPHLHEKVFHKSEAAAEEARDEFISGEYSEPVQKRRTVNMDYSTTDSMRGFSLSVEDTVYEPREDDIVYDASESVGDANAEDVFTNSFEPFDFKLNEELSNKPSSRAATEPKEPEGISEFTESINEITYEDVEKARQRADFEMKKRAAIDAQNRYAKAQAEIDRQRAERAAEAQRGHSAEGYNSNPYATEACNEEPVARTEPYIPEYMQKTETTATEEVAPKPQASAESYRRAASFASAISDYEKEKQRTEFKPYTPPIREESVTHEPQPERPEPEELKITRTMLEPTPSPTVTDEEPETTPELDFDDGMDTKVEFDFDTDDSAEESAAFDFTANESIPDEEDFDSREIPPSEQSKEVLEQRKLFPFLDTETEIEQKEETESGYSDSFANEDYCSSDEEAAPTDTEEEQEEVNESKADMPPFELSPLSKLVPPEKPKPEPAPPQEKIDYSDYQYPPVDLLAKGKIEEDLNQEEEKNQNAEKLVDALLQFNVRISIKGIDRGPRITRYEIVPARGVKVNSVTNLFNDIALNLGVEGMRMEAPIPGKSAIGVEIPNKKPSTVLLRDLVESDEFICAESKTMSCLGKDVTGNPVFADIAKMPHVLVAGATGMGKSVCINSILISILYKARPDEVKFIMIDPKKVEFNGYNGIPHLLVPVVTDVKQAAGALMWAVEQMEKRYDLMEALEVRKLDSYNEKVRENPSLGEPLPKIIIVIDELNDIMLQVRKPAEDLIMSIAQKARAAGIHLIIGTQRPSVDVITGVIKANIPSRISCKVASYNDSKTILEQAGAEKLLNNGDMLYIPAGAPKALRVQGAFVSDGEVAAIMKFLKSQAKGSVYDAQALEEINRAAQKCSKGKGGDDYDDDDGDDGENMGVLNDQQFLDAVELAVKSGKISTSLIQRKISVGYGKAAKFIDIMEDMGIVSEPNGQKPRDVLVTKDEWHEMLSRRSLD